MKKVKKEPVRTCLGCNEKKPKRNLIRVVRATNNELKIDLTGKLSGRGTYICFIDECFQKTFKGKRLESALKITVSEEQKKALKDELKKLIANESK